jgi:MFS transporter, DHA2 family, multidrug resistance protein
MLFFALFCVLFTAIFNYTISLMAATYIVSDLGGSYDISTYGVSFFAIGNVLSVPLGRTLLPRLGAARLLFISLLLFTLFSWCCAASSTYPLFVLARFFLGFAIGPVYVLVFFLFGALQPPEKKGFFSGIIVLLFTTCPVLGACWGGWIAYEFHWRWIFYFNLPFLLLLSFYLHYRLTGFDKTKIPLIPFDGIGYTAFFIGILALTSVAITGQELDWFRSDLITGLVVVGGISFLFFVLWELTTPSPFLGLKLLKSPILSFALFNLAVLFSAYFGMVILLSLWLKLWVNYTPDWIATLLGVMALTALFPPLLLSKRLKSVDDRVFLALAIMFLAISCFYTMFFNVEINFGRIGISRLYAGLGLALFLTPLFRLCFSAVKPEQLPSALVLFQVVRGLASGLGASVYDIVWQRRQIFYHDRLGSKITALSPETQEFFAKAKTIGLKGDFANAQLEYYLQREATSLALDDCFYLMGWILTASLVVFAFTFFSKTWKKRSTSQTSEQQNAHQ